MGILLWKMAILLSVETLWLTFARQWDTIKGIFIVILSVKLQFIELTLEMQNSECKMQNCGIQTEND